MCFSEASIQTLKGTGAQKVMARAIMKRDAALHALPRMAPSVTEWERLVTTKQRQHNPTGWGGKRLQRTASEGFGGYLRWDFHFS